MPDRAPASDLPGPLAWALQFLPDYFTDAPSSFHAELMADLQAPELRLIARVAPRGHAKSTCAALAYPLWCVCTRTRRNILLITFESSLACQFLRDIRNELESNERIRAAYGDLVAAVDEAPARGGAGSGRRGQKRIRRKWSEQKFTTTTGITVQAKGSGASLRGTRVGPHRPDLIVCDDIETDEQVASPRRRHKLEHWLRRVVMPALAPDGQLLVLGSLIHYDSLLANLRDRQRFPRWNYRVYRALEAGTGSDGRFVLRALWPARWPVERLEEERVRIGTFAFEQEYMANPVDESLRVFRPEWLRPYEPGVLEARRSALVNLLAVDPATGASAGDYFALWAGSLDTGTGILYTRELTLERIGVVEQVRRIVAAFERWRPVKIGIETNAYQVALKHCLEDHSRSRRLFMPITSLHTAAHKVARIQGSAPSYENGTFRLPPGLPREVEAQFLHFPKGEHDDAPDVCAMGIELARSLRHVRAGVEVVRPGRGTRHRRGGW